MPPPTKLPPADGFGAGTKAPHQPRSHQRAHHPGQIGVAQIRGAAQSRYPDEREEQKGQEGNKPKPERHGRRSREEGTHGKFSPDGRTRRRPRLSRRRLILGIREPPASTRERVERHV